MPGARTHFKIGCFVGAGYAFFRTLARQNEEIECGRRTAVDLGEVVGMACVGALTGGLAAGVPDILEPATSPNHRDLFHSAATLVACLKGAGHAQESELEIVYQDLVTCSLLGVASHIVADSQTPKGIKLLAGRL